MQGSFQLEEETYQTHEFETMDENLWKKINNPQDYHIALAKFGGPIAIARDKNKQIMLNTEVQNQVIFCNNKGIVVNKIEMKDIYTGTQNIVGFDFIEDELLLVVLDNGTYYLLNPFKNQFKVYSVAVPKKEHISQAKCFNNGFAFLLSNGSFFYVHNAFEPLLKQFPPATKNKFIPNDWLVISPENSSSQLLEIHVAHDKEGVVILTEDDGVKHFFGSQDFTQTINRQQMPIIEGIEMMAASFDCKLFAYLVNQRGQWSVQVVSQDFQESQLSIYASTNLSTADGMEELLAKDNIKRPIQMLWCGGDNVIFVFKRGYMIVGPNTFQVTQKSNTFCSSEVDGVRIISKKRNEIVRKCPAAYVNAYQLFSEDPGYKLQEAYQSYKNQEPFEEEDIRSKKQELAEGVLQCIEAGTFELVVDKQAQFLKAASYGKTFLNPSEIDHDILYQKCKYLRVVNNINNQTVTRTMTYQQAINLKEERFVKILLRYQQHHLAFEVCKYLNFEKKDQLIPQIYEHWACCKVEQQEDDTQLCFMIKDKLSDQKGLSYTEIAHKAIEIGKPQLALKLLDLEPEKAKRVPVLLSMAQGEEKYQKLIYFEKALEEALQCRESNFINMVILEMMQSDCNKESIFLIINQNLVSNQHFMLYLRHFENAQLAEFLLKTNQFYQLAFNDLRKCSNEMDAKVIDKNLANAQTTLKQDKQAAELSDIVSQWQGNLKAYLEKLKEKGSLSKGPDQIIPNIIVSHMMKGTDVEKKDIQSEAKDQRISQRTLYILKCKELIEEDNIVQLTNLLSTINKKKILVPYEIVADLLMQKGRRQTALQLLEKMTNLKAQIKIFMELKEPQKAIDSIVNSGKGRSDKKKYLENLMDDYQNPELNDMVQVELDNLKKK